VPLSRRTSGHNNRAHLESREQESDQEKCKDHNALCIFSSEMWEQSLQERKPRGVQKMEKPVPAQLSVYTPPTPGPALGAPILQTILQGWEPSVKKRWW